MEGFAGLRVTELRYSDEPWQQGASTGLIEWTCLTSIYKGFLRELLRAMWGLVLYCKSIKPDSESSIILNEALNWPQVDTSVLSR